MRGSCRRRRLMRWTAPRKQEVAHLIRHGSAVPPSPHRGRHLVRCIPKAPLSGADSPYQGEMSRRDKRGRDAVSRRLTERSSQICCSLSVPAFRRAAFPERGGFFAHPIYKNSTKIPSNPCNWRKRVVLLWRNPQRTKSGYPLFHLQKTADEVFCWSHFGKTDAKENGQ